MSLSIETILDRIKQMLSESENLAAKISFDREAAVIRIYGEGSDHVKRAHSAISDVQELAYTTAEHHPYWVILYHSSEIAKTVLEKWDTQLARDQVGEMSWRCDEIKMALERLDLK
jgi:hypothetical protein